MEMVLRVVIVYLFILVGLRVLGKREFSQLSTLELVALLIISELVSQALTRGDYSLTNGLIAVATLFVLVFLTSLLTYASKRAEAVIAAEPSILVYDGKLVADTLAKERVTPGEVLSEAHKSGLERVEHIQWALLESDGKISIIPKSDPSQDDQDVTG